MGNSNFFLAVVVVFIVGFLIWFFKRLKKVQDEIKELIDQKFKGQVIHLRDPLALHIARQSCGYSQKRGNGNLILTDNELFFAMTIPKTIISIPLHSITGVERVSRMGGKCIMKTLLKVNFKTESGEDDAIGWHVKELDRWESGILSRIANK